MNEAEGGFWLFVLMLLGAVLYFLPTIVAVKRDHPNMASIFFLDLLAGWTAIGWLGALIWSLSHIEKKPAVKMASKKIIEQPTSGTKECPQCAETIKEKAKVCRYCGAKFDLEAVT